MTITIRAFTDDDMPAIVELSLRAWAPVFESFEQIMGSKIFQLVYPDWREIQASVVTRFCKETQKNTTVVAEYEGIIAGFLVYTLDQDEKVGEVQLLAVHPDYQNQSIGTELNLYALQKMQENGMRLAAVNTGGDPSHAPARRCYEKAGFTGGITSVHYYKALTERSA